MEVFRCANVLASPELQRALLVEEPFVSHSLVLMVSEITPQTSETTFGHSKLFCLPFLCLHILERKKLQKLEDALVEQLLASDYC